MDLWKQEVIEIYFSLLVELFELLRFIIYIFKGRLKSSKADQDILMDSDQKGFIIYYSLSCCPYTFSTSVAVFGSHW